LDSKKSPGTKPPGSTLISGQQQLCEQRQTSGQQQISIACLLQDMTEDDKYTCPVCTRLLQKKQRLEQRRMEAEAAAEIEREAREAQAARKAKLVSHCSSGETVAALVLMTDAFSQKPCMHLQHCYN